MSEKNRNDRPNFLQSRFMLTIYSILLSFIVGALFLGILGISPITAYGKLIDSIFGKVKYMANSVVYATPLILIGLSVAFSFRTGVFNIGAEGQFVVGTMAACVVGILGGNLPGFLLIPLCFIAAAIAGALWGILVAFLKTKWGINEILSMIMFNWIAFYLSNYIAALPGIKSTGSAEATANVAEQAMIHFPDSWQAALGNCKDANWGILIAIVAMFVIWLILDKTTLGYELKSVGFNKNAAEYAGINVNRSIFTAMIISGVLCGIAGATQLLGMSQRIPIFSAQESYGFQGIIVALIGASTPVGCFVGGLFYGALKFGSSKLNLVGAPSEVINIITGTIVFFIAISDIFKFKSRKKG